MALTQMQSYMCAVMQAQSEQIIKVYRAAVDASDPHLACLAEKAIGQHVRTLLTCDLRGWILLLLGPPCCFHISYHSEYTALFECIR